MEGQKVEVYVSIGGNYTAFNEMSMRIEYDITNKKQIGYATTEEMDQHFEDEENGAGHDYTDYDVRDAYLIDGIYYVQWNG